MSYLRSSMVPQFFKNPDPAIPVPRVVAPEQLRVRDDSYYTVLGDALVAPSQGEIEEQQEFLATIYKVIEDKLAEEEGIYLASNSEVSEEKWQPLAPDADIPAADIISQELNNLAVAKWNKLDDYCRLTTQTWYNIRFKELKEDSAKALNIDPVTFQKIKTSMEWLADEFEKAGTNPAYAAQQAMDRAESVLSSNQGSRANTLVPVQLPKQRAKSADAVLRSHPSTPENKDSIAIRTPMPKNIKERLESIPSDITSLDYIDEPAIDIPTIKQEPQSPKDIEMSTVIVNPAPIRHKPQTELVVEPVVLDSKGKGKEKDTMLMDTSEDFGSKNSSDIKYHTAPSTLSPALQKFTRGVTPLNAREDKLSRSHMPLRVLSNGEELLNFMEIAEKNLTRADQVEFHKELDKKGYHARSAYLEVMLNGLFGEAIDPELHQGHYHPIKDVYDNFNDPLEKFEDQVESMEKDKTLFAILPYKLYSDLLVHWLVTHKYIKQAINVPSDGSMEKITWSYLNALFDHRFNDMLSEVDFLHCVKGLHGILDKEVQGKYDLTNFGKDKEGIAASIHAPKTVYVEKEKIVYVEKNMENQGNMANPESQQPSLLQQRQMKNRSVTKSSSYDKNEVKNILTMASQLSDKLDIPITDAFDKAEEILSITQSTGCSSSRSRSRSQGRQAQTATLQQPWHMASDPQKITDLAMMIKALLDAKPKAPKKKVPAKFTKSDKLSPVSLGTPTNKYNILMAKQNVASGSQPN
ncbi:hypothetical protein AX15_004185 [Amanita polypyramis BW_CC]|nr:hypothetical protein AX15_004185 [Amanita polypyramis BW_CC]